MFVLDRLRNPDKLAQRLVDYKDIQAGFPAFSVAEEGGSYGCLHYQGIVEIDITNASYAQKFKRKGYKGNQCYSTKKVDDNDKDRTLQYLCKAKFRGDTIVVVNNTMNLTEDQMLVYHNKYWDEHDQLSGKKTKSEKKESHREKFYADFIDFLKSQEDVDMGKYKLQWIGKKFFRFLGNQPRPELVNWIKGVVFSSQAVLLNHDESDASEKAIERWCDQVFF